MTLDELVESEIWIRVREKMPDEAYNSINFDVAVQKARHRLARKLAKLALEDDDE